jgi:hypothetical protein
MGIKTENAPSPSLTALPVPPWSHGHTGTNGVSGVSVCQSLSIFFS